MAQKIQIGNVVIDDPIVVEYSYRSQHFHVQQLSDALEKYRYAIALAVAEKSEYVNDYLPIGIVENFEEANIFIRNYQKENHLPYRNPMYIEE